MKTKQMLPQNNTPDQEPDGHFLPDGRFVFTAAYHRRRGYCCGNGCSNCPFDFEAVPEPRRSDLLASRKAAAGP